MRFAERRDARIRQHQLDASYWIDGKWIFLNDRRGGYKLKRAGPTARVGRENPHAPLGEAMPAIYLNARWHCSTGYNLGHTRHSFNVPSRSSCRRFRAWEVRGWRPPD